jgi:hypothetical protein
VTAASATTERRSAELLAIITDAVASVEPELPAGTVAAALDGIGRLRRPRLAAWLLAHPDALVSGASAAPKVVAEFILLAGPDGRVPAVLVPVRDAIGSVDNPVTGIGWLHRSPAAALLARIAHGELALSHQTLDDAPRDPRGRAPAAVADLRRGAARPRPRTWPAWSGSSTSTPPPWPTTATVAWSAPGRPGGCCAACATKPLKAPPIVHRAFGARGRLRQAVRFLTWLQQHGKTLAACQQADIDRWLAGPAHTRRLVRPFLAWALERHALTGVQLPRSRSGGTPQAADAEQRWALARRLLHDPGLDPSDRVAGALVVLFAQPLSRIANRTLADITTHPGSGLVAVRPRPGRHARAPRRAHPPSPHPPARRMAGRLPTPSRRPTKWASTSPIRAHPSIRSPLWGHWRTASSASRTPRMRSRRVW